MSLRGWARLIAIALWVAICLLGWAIARPFGRSDRWVRRFLAGTARLIGLRIAIDGAPRPGPVLWAANHITFLDILVLGTVAPVRFIAKDEIAGWRLVGLLAKVGGAIFVARDRRGDARAQADRVSAALTGSRPVVLFGEGGTGDGLAVQPFRASLFVSAIEAGVPVQPVAIDYGPARARFAWPDGASFSREARKILNRAEPVPVTVRFLASIGSADRNRKALAAESHRAVAAALA